MLFTREPCSLNLARAEEMHRAWMNYAAYQVGCWAPTVNGDFFFVGQLPSLTHPSGISWQYFPRAVLHEDDSVTITEPNYDSNTFMAQQSQRQLPELDAHRKERP